MTWSNVRLETISFGSDHTTVTAARSPANTRIPLHMVDLVCMMFWVGVVYKEPIGRLQTWSWIMVE